MFSRLLALFIGVPLIELVLLHKLAQVISLTYTILLVVATGVIGAALARWQGVRTWQAIQTQLQAGQLPSDKLLDAAMIFLAGPLLITPGLLTDMTGFLLLCPPFRRVLRGWLKQYFQRNFSVHTMGSPFAPDDPAQGNADMVIDSYVVDRPAPQDRAPNDHPLNANHSPESKPNENTH